MCCCNENDEELKVRIPRLIEVDLSGLRRRLISLGMLEHETTPWRDKLRVVVFCPSLTFIFCCVLKYVPSRSSSAHACSCFFNFSFKWSKGRLSHGAQSFWRTPLHPLSRVSTNTHCLPNKLQVAQAKRRCVQATRVRSNTNEPLISSFL